MRAVIFLADIRPIFVPVTGYEIKSSYWSDDPNSWQFEIMNQKSYSYRAPQQILQCDWFLAWHSPDSIAMATCMYNVHAVNNKSDRRGRLGVGVYSEKL